MSTRHSIWEPRYSFGLLAVQQSLTGGPAPLPAVQSDPFEAVTSTAVSHSCTVWHRAKFDVVLVMTHLGRGKPTVLDGPSARLRAKARLDGPLAQLVEWALNH